METQNEQESGQQRDYVASCFIVALKQSATGLVALGTLNEAIAYFGGAEFMFAMGNAGFSEPPGSVQRTIGGTGDAWTYHGCALAFVSDKVYPGDALRPTVKSIMDSLAPASIYRSPQVAAFDTELDGKNRGWHGA